MDIYDEVMRFRAAFISNGMEPPDIIVLKSHDDGMKFLRAFAQHQHRQYMTMDFLKDVRHPDGSVYKSFDMCGIS